MPTGSEYQRIEFRQQDSNYRTHGEERSGEFAQNASAPDAPQVPADTYPNNYGYGFDASNRQFSSDKDGDPQALLEPTRTSVMAHSDMNKSYGLNQPVATVGSHPWLRDSLVTPAEDEPGNAEPVPSIKVPQDKDV